MTIRIYDAFSGNNSGTYALLGTFETPADARRLRDELALVFEQQKAWRARVHAARSESSPLHALMREAGIPTAANLGEHEWPDMGEAPSVVSAADQVLVFVPYVQSFPRAFGELVYKRGGRVSIELQHAHGVAMEHRLWSLDGDGAQAAKFEAFREAIEDGALRELFADADGVVRMPPILRIGRAFLRLIHVSQRESASVLHAVGELASRLQLETDVSLFEVPDRGEDPLRSLRAYDVAPGDCQVILWDVGARRNEVIRAARSVTGLSLAEATELVHRAPIEVLKEVSQREAEIAFETLRAAGADAEILGPQHFRRR